MPIYIISCPACKQKYRLMPKDPSSLSGKNFSCPKCQYSTPFFALIKDLPQHITRSDSPISSPLNQQKQHHNETKVSLSTGGTAKAYVTVEGSNNRFVLTQGVYILGRMSSDSMATLKLAPDICMSRQHARLAVQMVGGKMMAQIIGLKKDNPIFVNGKIYAAGQPCTLKSGDNIQLGSTRIIFSI